MKKLFLILLFVLLAFSLFAKGEQEAKITQPGDPVVLLFAVDGGIGQGTGWYDMIQEFTTKHPNVTVKWLGLDIASGGVEALSAYIAAGIRPLFKDFMGRSGKFMVEEYALNLSPYIPDLEDYLPGTLDMMTRNGKIYGLPLPTQAMGFFVRTDILDQIGFEVEEGWTIDDWLKMAAKIKNNTDVYPTYIFAANQSADYYYMSWFAMFGAHMYKNGDYSKTTLNSPEGVEAMTFLKLIYDLGYVPQEASVLTAMDYIKAMGAGKFASGNAWANEPANRMKSMVDQGVISEPFPYKMVDFPKAPGVEVVQHCGQFHGIVCPRSDYVENGKRRPKDQVLDDLYGEFAIAVRDTETNASMASKTGGLYPVRSSEVSRAEGEDFEFVNSRFLKAGLWDVGMSTQQYSAVRAMMFPRLQALFSGAEDPAEAMARYEENVNAAIAEFE